MKIGKHYIVSEKEMNEIMEAVFFAQFQAKKCVLYSNELKEQGREEEDDLPKWARIANEVVLEACNKAEEVYIKLS